MLHPAKTYADGSGGDPPSVKTSITTPDICSRSAFRESCGVCSVRRLLPSVGGRSLGFRTFGQSVPRLRFPCRRIAANRVVTDPPHSKDDLDGNADREAEIVVRAPLIDRDFGKPVRILVPEGRVWRPIAEGSRALQRPTRHGKPCAGRQHSRPQPDHGIAEMIDVNDFAEVVWPVCLPICTIVTWSAGGQVTARQHGCNRREEVAPVKTGREAILT